MRRLLLRRDFCDELLELEPKDPSSEVVLLSSLPSCCRNALAMGDVLDENEASRSISSSRCISARALAPHDMDAIASISMSVSVSKLSLHGRQKVTCG